MFAVVMHNDDYSTMEFVVEALVAVFHKSPTEANRIMLQIHFKGSGLCGTYPYEIAETRVSKVHDMARQRGFPLRCSLEPA
jgi:ATP-dependent Clp protease adaptor protein ClpS